MTIPRLGSLLLMLALAHDVLAVQMGQISSKSVRGQPLVARVALYGLPHSGDMAMRAELLPAFGAPDDSLSMFDIEARIVSDEQGAQAILITSARAYDAATLALRIRLHEGSHAQLRHYELNVPAAPIPPPARAASSAAQRLVRPVARSAPAPRSGAAVPRAVNVGNYGPVRVGQSLWTILQETGLAHGDSRALMHDVVAANPQAFVAGDATRLRVGVMLQLPQRDVRTASAAGRPTATPIASATDDAETAARLERLAIKFAELRARYAEQHVAPSVASTTPNKRDDEAPAPASLTTRPSKLAQPAPRPVIQNDAAALPIAKPAANQPLASVAPAPPAQANDASSTGLVATIVGFIDDKLLIELAVGLSAVALLLFGARFARRLRSRLAEANMRGADLELVAEIARKTEKRVQLEGEVKRMIAERRDGGEQPSSNALRPADLLAGPRASLEEIETRIAHGQYNEAEAMLEQTIADTPNNYRAKLRLAEIYYLNERHEEFVELADEIHRRHRSDIGDENWARLMRMGKIIAPDRPPFSGPIAVEAGRRTR